MPDAGYYLIYLSYDREFTNLVYGNKADANSLPWTTNTRWTPPTALKESQAGGAYYWFIRPCKATGACAPDPTSATHAFQKKSNEVERLSPSQRRHSRKRRDVRLDGLPGDQPEGREGEPGDRARRSRSRRGRTTSRWARPRRSARWSTTWSSTRRPTPPFCLDLPGGHPLLASPGDRRVRQRPRLEPSVEVRQEVTDGRPWTVPADGCTVSGTQPFRWKPLNFAASYDIEVYKNGDTNASAANLVISANSQQTAYSPTRAAAGLRDAATSGVFVGRMPTGGEVPGAPGGRSRSRARLPRWSVRSPDARDERQERALHLEGELWSGVLPVRAAARNVTARTTSAVATSSTAYAPTGVLPRGRWKWRVTSYDGSYQPIKSSAWRGFRAY